MRRYLKTRRSFTPHLVKPCSSERGYRGANKNSSSRKPRPLGRGAGFTFLEVLASLIILSIALIPIMTWVPASIQAKLKTERKTTAIFLAQAKLEEARSGLINDFTQGHNRDSLAFSAPYQDFRYTITDNLDANLKTISVKVWHIENPQDETIFYTQVAQR